MRDSCVHRLVLYLEQGSSPLTSKSGQMKPLAEEKRLQVPFYFNAGLVTDTNIFVLLKIPLAQMILPEVSSHEMAAMICCEEIQDAL